MRFIDLRSDTVTEPTEEMRLAMAAAKVGDDVYGDDPTVSELERVAAGVFGKEAAMFVPTGTMGNQLCIMTATRRGDEVLTGTGSHIVNHEAGAMAVLSGVMARALPFPNDIPEAAMLEGHISSGSDVHMAPTGLISYENATSSGRVVPEANMRGVYELAQKRGIPVHVDGARIFNAATALGVSVRDLARHCDCLMACVSKGLCAPIGSVIAGSAGFIARARKNRKLLGGGMRQAGLIAAPAIIALEKMPKRLTKDHENAAYMAGRLAEIPGISLNPASVEINMVFFAIDRPAELLDALPERMKARGVKINGSESGGLMRFVTHNGVSRADIDEALRILREEIA